MQVLLVTDKFPPELGGACAVAEALASHQPEVISVAAPRYGDVTDWNAFDRSFNFTVHRVDAFASELPRWLHPKARGALQFAYNKLWTRPKAIRSLYKFLAKHPVDIVCVNTLICYWVPQLLQRRYPHLRVVSYLHGEEVSAGGRLLDRLANARLRLSDAIVVVSSFTRGLAIGVGVPADRITVINNGVDTTRFTPGPPDPGIIDRFQLSNKKVLLCLARLDERKGQDTLIASMPKILLALPETVLLLVGGGSDEARLRSLVQSLGLEDSVIFAGIARDEELVAYYRTADVYVMPNRTTDSGDTEGFGLVFLEAGACRKAVVGGRAGGVPDAVLDGETGYLVDGRSTDEVASACIRLLSDPVLADQFGRRGLQHAQQLTWQAQSEKFLDVCKGLRVR